MDCPQRRGELVNPPLAVFLEAVKSYCLEPFKYMCICSLHLPFATRMSITREVELGPDFLVVFGEVLTGELRAIVSDDTVGDSKVANNSTDEFDCHAHGDLGDGKGFSPLCEVVNGNKEVLAAPDCLREGPQDI